MGEFLFGEMSVEFHGFYISMILKFGYLYVIKAIMAYFEIKLEKIEKDELFNTNNAVSFNLQRERIMKSLLGRVEDKWPRVFINVESFDI
jgi:hypothetical protein